MKKLIVLGVFAMTSIVGMAQSGELSLNQRMSKINFSASETGFKKLATDAGLSWECCIELKCDCTDLKDPWEAKKTATPKEQISSILNDKTVKKVQKDMAMFEQAILSGKGKNLLSAKVAQQAFEKQPGYSKNSIKNRLEIYILSMQSETEDE